MVDKNKFSDCEDRHDVVFQSLGAASACWDNLEGAGVFRSEDAKEIGDHALARLGELDEPLLGLATTEQLLNELKARMEFDDKDPASLTLRVNCEMALAMLLRSTLAYRTVDS